MIRKTKVTQDLPKPIQFTEAGFAKVAEDVARLSELRKEILVRLQTAREMGDLSENGAYKAARFELSTTDRELRRLNFLLRFGVVTKTKNNGQVNFGTTVTVNDGTRDMTFMLVDGYESDPKQQKLSLKSPIGHAVFGKKVGDTAVVTTPLGLKQLTVVKVE